MSEEHLWPEWMHPLLENNPGHTQFMVHLVHSNPKVLTSHPTLRKPQKALQKRTLKVVCEKCNNQWMSKCENEIKSLLTSLIKDEESYLDQNTQNKLAYWIAVKVAVAEYLDPKTICITNEEKKLISQGSIPKNWFIWIGRCKKLGNGINYHHHAYEYFEGDRTRRKSFDPIRRAQVTIITAGQFIAYVHSYGLKDSPPLTPNAYHPYLQMIWPENRIYKNKSLIYVETYFYDFLRQSFKSANYVASKIIMNDIVFKEKIVKESI